MNIQEEILKSIEVMIDKSLNRYNSTRTEASVVEGIKNGKYQVTVDGTKCYVYDSVGCNPKVGNAVWVQIPNGSLTNAFITGRKNKSVDGFFNGSNNDNTGGGNTDSPSGNPGDGNYDNVDDPTFPDLNGGTKDYNKLENLPSINGIVLQGNKIPTDLEIKLNQLIDDSEHRLVTDEEKEKWNSNSSVEWNQLQKDGSKIAEIIIDDNITNIYAPMPGVDCKVEDTTLIISSSGENNNTAFPIDGSRISYNGSLTGLTSTNIQDAIDELYRKVADILSMES